MDLQSLRGPTKRAENLIPLVCIFLRLDCDEVGMVNIDMGAQVGVAASGLSNVFLALFTSPNLTNSWGFGKE